VALGGDIVGPADQPGIFGRTVQAELLKKLFQSAIELPLRAVTVEIKGEIGAGTHALVYAQKEQQKKRGAGGVAGNEKGGQTAALFNRNGK
jgi:hypothetical protein